ncbi:MAG: hypothetical protein IT307_02770 [Chloroflexi bacterium]|nr:hypothetical protein [Chloroflexota bacterium]
MSRLTAAALGLAAGATAILGWLISTVTVRYGRALLAQQALERRLEQVEETLGERDALSSGADSLGQAAASEEVRPPKVLILTPVKDAWSCIEGYCQRLQTLTYPHDRISVGLLESDSSDGTDQFLRYHLPTLRDEFRKVGFWKQDFGYRLPADVPRWTPSIQVGRRNVLAKSRNTLLFHALDDEDWVLWLDVDVVEYPPDLIERLLAVGHEIVQPHCVLEYGGATFDTNGWRDHGRLHLDDLREEGEQVELDAVGGTVLLVRADVHREGLIFPPFLYGKANPRVRRRRTEIEGEIEGELETEGLGIMARDLGYVCWGLPRLEVRHRRA